MNTFNKLGGWTTAQWMKFNDDKYKEVEAWEEKKYMLI